MIPKPTLECRRAIQSLAQQEEFTTFLNWIQSGLNARRRENDYTRELIDVGQGQGCAKTLQTILDEVDKNDEALEKLSRNPQGSNP